MLNDELFVGTTPRHEIWLQLFFRGLERHFRSADFINVDPESGSLCSTTICLGFSITGHYELSKDDTIEIYVKELDGVALDHQPKEKKWVFLMSQDVYLAFDEVARWIRRERLRMI